MVITVNSLKFVRSYFRGLLRNCIFMDAKICGSFLYSIHALWYDDSFI